MCKNFNFEINRMSSETTTTATATSTLPRRSPATRTPEWPDLTPSTTDTAVNAESTTSPTLSDSDRSESKDPNFDFFLFFWRNCFFENCTKKALYSSCYCHLENIVGVTFVFKVNLLFSSFLWKIKFDFLFLWLLSFNLAKKIRKM